MDPQDSPLDLSKSPEQPVFSFNDAPQADQQPRTPHTGTRDDLATLVPSTSSAAGAGLAQRLLPGSSNMGSRARSTSSQARPAPTPAATRPQQHQQSVLWSAAAREASVLRGRQGSVLARGLVLKTDHFQGTSSRQPSHLDLALQGAPNFRKADAPLEVYGVAQPTITGVKTILTVLESTPLNADPQYTPRGDQQEPLHTSWVCTREEPILYIGARPFVLREHANPTVSFSLSSRAENLEAIEVRLKHDVIREAARFGGLILCHEEAGDASDPRLKPTWISIDADTVKTVREVFEELRAQGWRCNYHRVPIGTDQPIENNYLDAYTRILRNLDPTRTCVVANCGAGFARTTFAMVAAQIIRRRQLMLMGRPDPFQLSGDGSIATSSGATSTGGATSPPPAGLTSPTASPALAGLGSPTLASAGPADKRTRDAKANSTMLRRLRATWEKQAQAQSLLRLVQLLANAGSDAPVDLLLANPQLLESLRRALTGDYSVIRALCGILDQGMDDKVVVDVAIDSAAHLTNLREAVLLERSAYALAGADGGSASSSGSGSSSHATATATNTPRKAPSVHLDKAVRALEKYFFLCAFASYVSGSQKAVFEHRFADWLKTRSEIWNTIRRIRTKGKQLYLFDPVADLSQLRRPAALSGIPGGINSRLRIPGTFLAAGTGTSAGTAAAATGDILDERLAAGDEFAEHHVRNLRSGIVLRPGTLLKEDVWQAQREHRAESNVLDVRGTINFRRIPGTAIFATGQPTAEGIRGVLRSVAEQLGRERAPAHARIACTWLNLREEPLLYVAGKPYVLRDSTLSLRNIKAYGGISWARLQLLEDRLKADVISELEQNDGRLLLHSEDTNGEVFPVWREVDADEVETLQDVMAKIAKELPVDVRLASEDSSDRDGDASAETPESPASASASELIFRRIPLTAERPPDFEDMGSLLQMVLRSQGGSIINNCQLGRGRSTLASVIVLLISQWLHRHSGGLGSASTGVAGLDEDEAGGRAAAAAAGQGDDGLASESGGPAPPRLSYHLINSLLRVVPHGLQVNEAVDNAIDRAGNVMNLRSSIEECRLAAEEIEDPDAPERRARIHAGCQALRRYFSLIVFQAYLNATRPDTITDMPTFESFVKRQPVLNTIGKEFHKVDVALITPLQRVEAADGMALDAEVNEVVANRDGAILTAYTMLKSDFFSGIAKVHLSQIEGIPNLRSVPLLVGGSDAASSSSSSSASLSSTVPQTPLSAPGRETWGSGMPTIDGLRRGLEKMGAGEGGSATPNTVVWTSLREEPVIYVRGRPHVLRLADQPLTNLEATGISTETVERQEIALKGDVIREASRREGRILLHDEVEIEPGRFDIVPVWESIRAEDVLTPREAYEQVQREGFRVEYARVAVTDEQAPVPAVFSEIEKRVLRALAAGASTAFNCQMGRGRTTTGMVIASLISTVYHQGADAGAAAADADAGAGAGALSGAGAKDYLDNREDELWLQGEYRTVLQLVGVLSHGKAAKRLTDAAIDRMEAVQNLRKAIYDARMRAENAEPGSKKRRGLATVYGNYLQRYGFLIAFANYLVEKSKARALTVGTVGSTGAGGAGEANAPEGTDAQSQATADDGASTATRQTHRERDERERFPSFLAWLKPRREVSSIIQYSTDDRVAP